MLGWQVQLTRMVGNLEGVEGRKILKIGFAHKKKMYKVDAGKKTDICNSPNRFSHSDNGQPLNYREFHIISFSEKDVV